jgi:predicted PurR-regulated permease PerM
MAEQNNPDNKYGFVKKVWIVGLIFSLIAVILLIFEATFNILILVLAGALIACFFRGISAFIQRKTHWAPWITLTISIIVSFLIIAGMFFLVGAKVTSDSANIQERLPDMINEVKVQLKKSGVGRKIIAQANSIKSSKQFSSFISTFFKTTFGGIANIYIVVLLGIFFTIGPQIYSNGIMQLVPPRKRKKADGLINHIGSSLKKWLAGKFIAMAAVFVLTAIGLIILDVPMWLTLSIIAGLLNFIPNFGPLVAAVPAILVGFSQSPMMALIIAALYLFVQVFESSFITPQAQQKLVKIPPALIILAQVFVGALTGIWGVIFATPLLLIIIIVIQELYTEPMNRKSEMNSEKLNSEN